MTFLIIDKDFPPAMNVWPADDELTGNKREDY